MVTVVILAAVIMLLPLGWNELVNLINPQGSSAPESQHQPDSSTAGNDSAGNSEQGTPAGSAPAETGTAEPPSKGTDASAGKSQNANGETTGNQAGQTNDDANIQVTSNPEDIAVLVNKHYKLPGEYEPPDLVEPNVPFIFSEKSEKRLMRKEAAEALEKLFAGAKQDGVSLAGVSAYRSYKTQNRLFSYYASKDGIEAANKYSALPGQSEHQTGLAIDVSGIGGKCAAEDCFAGTTEAKWLAAHAAEYGFIIRYPKGKESLTGYSYEPWHIRYVGKEIAGEIAAKGITLEEYLSNGTLTLK